MMAIPTAINSTNNISGAVLLSHAIDIVMKKQEKQHHDLLSLDNGGSFTNGTGLFSHIKTASDEAILEFLMPIWAYQTAAVYLIVISVIGLLMNVTVVIVVLNDPQKSPLNWMLLNLACSDGIIAGFGAPISAAAAFQFDWPFGDDLCVAYAMIMSTAGIGSITTLTALALWRCQLVVYCPAKRSSAFANNNNGGRLGHCQAVLLMTIIWTYSLAVTCPPLFGWGRYDREASHISCSVNWESNMDNNRLYIVYMFAFGLFVPLAVIVISYVSILRVVKKAGKFKRTMATTLHNVEQSVEIVDQQPMTVKKVEQKKQTSDAAEKRVTVMVACMVGAFLTAWTPYSILALYETFIGETGSPSNGNNVSSHENLSHYVGTISPGFATIPSLFAKSSAILNPLIYGLLNTQFRTAWEKFSTRFLCRRQPHPRKSKEIRRLLGCGGRRSPTLKVSTTAHFSMKEMVSNESQSAYVMARQLVASPPIVRFVQQHEQPIRLKFLSPSLASSSSTADPDASITHQQSIQMRSLKNSVLQQQQEQVEERNDPGKLAVILSITESTSCTTTTDDHVFTTTMDEESVFADHTPEIENVSDSVDVSVIFSPG